MNKKQGLAPIIIILIVVGILAAAGGGVYYFGKKQSHFTNSCPTAPKTCADGTQINLAQPNCNEICPEDILRKKIQKKTCKNSCGDSVCQEGEPFSTCGGEDCPCLETKESCPQDCAKENGQINQVSIADILSNSDQYLDKKVQLEEKFCGWGQTTGSAGPLFTRSDWCICQNPQKKAEQSLTVTGAALPDGVSPSESESIGEILSITGVVKKTSNNIPYIEAEKIVKE